MSAPRGVGKLFGGGGVGGGGVVGGGLFRLGGRLCGRGGMRRREGFGRGRYTRLLWSLGMRISRRGGLLCAHKFEGGDHEAAEGVPQDDEPNEEERFPRGDARGGEVEHIGDGVLVTAQNEGRNTEHYAERRLVVAVDIHREKDENSAEKCPDERLPPRLRLQFALAERKRRFLQRGNGGGEKVSARDRADKIPEQPQQHDGEILLGVLFEHIPDLARVQRESFNTDTEERRAEEHRAHIFADGGHLAIAREEYRPADRDERTRKETVNDLFEDVQSCGAQAAFLESIFCGLFFHGSPSFRRFSAKIIAQPRAAVKGNFVFLRRIGAL